MCLSKGIFHLLASHSEEQRGGSAALAGFLEQLCLPRTRGCSSVFGHLGLFSDFVSNNDVKQECYFKVGNKNM